MTTKNSKLSMKVNRNDQKFAVLNIASLLSHEGECNINNPKSLEKQFASLIDDVIQNKNLQHGKRVEYMFGFMTAALRECALIKHEDNGFFYTAENLNIQIPDYYILLKNNQELFVEVKNCHKYNINMKLTLSNQYVKRLLAYPKVSKGNLKIAIYWSRIVMCCTT